MVKLTQNPHRTSDIQEKVLEVAIGRELRSFRKQKNMTVSDLSKQTDISVGMLSKIENGNTSPSLTTLQTLANALSVPLTAFFRGFEEKREVVHTPAGQGVTIEREGTRAGHQYNLLGHIGANTSGVIVEPYLIVLNSESDTFQTFQHDGIGNHLHARRRYRLSPRVFDLPLRPGDTLFFEADAPHGPETLVDLPAKYLSIISYAQS